LGDNKNTFGIVTNFPNNEILDLKKVQKNSEEYICDSLILNQTIISHKNQVQVKDQGVQASQTSPKNLEIDT
jgi:hypothetical protein